MSSKVKRGAFAVLSIVAFLGAGNTAIAEEEAAKPAALKIRNFDHFEFDTVVDSYFGIATFYTHDDKVTFVARPGDPIDDQNRKTNTDVVTGEIRLVMGGETIQGGLVIPYHNTSGNDRSGGKDDIGDVRAHVKLVPLHYDLVDLGAGLMISFPGGSKDVGITTGKVGVLPFFTGTFHIGPVDLNTHLGYQFFNDQSADGAPESIFWGSSLKYAVIDRLGLRLELAGQSYRSGEDRNVLALEPGFDYRFGLGKLDFLLSAAGSYGLSGGTAGSEAAYRSQWGVNTISGLSRGQWGIGGALAVLWN